jgi:hypothetical protein
MKDSCSIVAHGPGWCEWNSDKFFFSYFIYLFFYLFIYVSEHRAGHAISPKHKLLKTEMMSVKCSKIINLCKSEETVDRWC